MEVITLAAVLSGVLAVDPDLGRIEHSLQHTDYQMRRRYRPHYHISAPFGWLSDPAAFVFFKDKYHLFYQYYPHEGSWGAMRWGHVASADLVQWTHYPAALLPRDAYDRRGCRAGSAVLYNGFLALYYTGETLVDNRTRQTQNVAVSSDGVLFQKYLFNPVLSEGRPAVDDLRNPKVWRARGEWYMIVGSSANGRGQLRLYRAPDLYKWRYETTIAESRGDMGYLWESPDLFELEGQSVLVLSVRGAFPDGYRFRNLHQSGYVTGHFDHAAVRFDDIEISSATFAELDHGHDFYAAKTARAADGRTLLVAWLGMWESEMLESREGWAGAVSLVREVHAHSNGRLRTPPARETVALRKEVLENAWYRPGESFYAGSRTFELVINSSISLCDVVLSLDWSGEHGYTVWYSAARRFVSVHRGGRDGERRADWSPRTETLHWRMFVDRSSVELFLGDGEVVFSSRIYPRRAISVSIGGAIQLHITQYRLKRSVGFDSTLRSYLRDHIIS